MFKKKEYKRSEWFEGLLYAENIKWLSCYSASEIFVDYVDSLDRYDIVYRNNDTERPRCIRGNVTAEFCKGVEDYLEYRKTL